MTRVLVIGALLAALDQGYAAPHRFRFYPNPALTILSIAEGPDGLLWLATTDGLYRFDGFHYHKITAYPFGSARFLAFTRDHTLWCAGFEGLTRARNHHFEVVAREDISSMAAFPDRLFIRLRSGLASVDLDGSVRLIHKIIRRDLTIDSLGTLWGVDLGPLRGCAINENAPDIARCFALPSGHEFEEVARDSLGRMWAADPEHAFLLENDRPVLKFERRRSIETNRPGPLLPGKNGQLWFVGEEIHGIHPVLAFEDRSERDHPPTSAVEDSKGNLWVATPGHGLTEWIRDPAWERWFPEDFGGEAPVQVIRDATGSVIVATQKHLYRRDENNQAWERLSNEEHRYYAILALENGAFLASTADAGLVRLSASGRILERIRDLAEKQFDRELIRDRHGRLWAGSKRQLLRIEGQPGNYRLRPEPLPGISNTENAQAVDLEIDRDGRLWAGYAKGIAWLDDNDRWHVLETEQPVSEVRSFALAGDEIWVAHRRPGSFSRLRRTGQRWSVDAFSSNAGYPPIDTEFMKGDSRGWIWRGSSNGVYISDRSRVAPQDWLHISMANGLSANEMGQYGFYEDHDGSVWLAGDEGLSHLRPVKGWFDAPQGTPLPQVTRLEADGRVFVFPDSLPMALAATTKVIRIDVGGLRGPVYRDERVRYRLLPIMKSWQTSRDGTLQFQNLPEQAYTLEIAFTAQGVSPFATLPFRIGSPPSWPYWTSVLFAATAVGLTIRYVPRFERVRFQIEKSLFLLRRRYSRKRMYSPPGTLNNAPDYSSTVLRGRYQLNRLVSRGGFSVVYEGTDLGDSHAKVAIKVLNTSPDRSPDEQSWLRDRFAHEVTTLRSINHPGVVGICDWWINPAGEPCLAMPFIEGTTLRAALHDGALGARRTASLVRQMGSALAAVHEHGIVHRDLKPENLMLSGAGQDAESLVMIDFGTAGLRTAENELAATTLMAGSFHYMAPERLTGHYSPATDVFAMGVIVLEMLTGKRLSDLKAMFSDAAFNGELEGLLRTTVSADTAKLVASLLIRTYNPEPRQRTSRVKEWSEEVAAALDQE